MHVHETTIRLRHTDAAGVLYFADVFVLAHAAYEDLLEALGAPLPPDLARAGIGYPIVHATADYRGVLRLGDRVRVEATVREVGARSFTLAYALRNADGEQAATVSTVHAAIDAATGRATALPEALAAALRGA